MVQSEFTQVISSVSSHSLIVGVKQNTAQYLERVSKYLTPSVMSCWAQLIAMSLFCSGFKEQIYDVYRYLPPATQVVLISATLPHEILEMTNKFMTDPIRILVKRSVHKPTENTVKTVYSECFVSIF